MKTIFKVSGYIAFSEQDNYENGCHGTTKNECLSGEYWARQADTFPELLAVLKDEFKCDDVMLNSCEEMGRLDLQGEQKTAFNCAKPSDKTMQEWKDGKLDLWLTCYTFHVEIIQSEIDLTTFLMY